jgi:AcrR family transcriptional regulator
MTFLDTMQAYFRGEKLEAVLFIVPLGLALMGFAVVALKVERGGFAWGVAAPCFAFGLLALITGGTVAARTARQVAAVERAWLESPAALATTELPRMEKVNADFRSYFAAFAILVAGGLTLVLVVHAPWARGLGPALILIGACGFMIDGFASRRAVPYTAALEELSGTRPGR